MSDLINIEAVIPTIISNLTHGGRRGLSSHDNHFISTLRTFFPVSTTKKAILDATHGHNPAFRQAIGERYASIALPALRAALDTVVAAAAKKLALPFIRGQEVRETLEKMFVADPSLNAETAKWVDAARRVSNILHDLKSGARFRVVTPGQEHVVEVANDILAKNGKNDMESMIRAVVATIAIGEMRDFGRSSVASRHPAAAPVPA